VTVSFHKFIEFVTPVEKTFTLSVLKTTIEVCDAVLQGLTYSKVVDVAADQVT
jgi:hypothetical protein